MDEGGEAVAVGLTSDIAVELFHVRPVSVANTADVELLNKSVETKFEPEKRKTIPSPEPASSPSPEPEEDSVTVADSLAILDTFSEVKWIMEEIADNFEKVAGRQGHVHRRAPHPIHVITTRHPMITSAINQLTNSILGFGDEVEALQNRTPTDTISEPTPEPVPANPALLETLELLQETITTIQTRKAERANKKQAKAAETLKALTEISKSLQILEGKKKFSEAVQADPVGAITSIWSTGKADPPSQMPAGQQEPQDGTGTSVPSIGSAVSPMNTPIVPGSMLFQESTISSKDQDAEELARTTEHHNKSQGRSSSASSGKKSDKSEKSEDSPGLLKRITSKIFGKSKDSSEQDDKSQSKKDKAAAKTSTTSSHKKSTSSKTPESQAHRKSSPTKDTMVIRDSKASKKSKTSNKDRKHSSSSSREESKSKKVEEKDPAQLAAERRAANQEKLTCLMNMLRSCHWVDGRIEQMWQKLNGPSNPMGMGGCSQPMNQPMCQQPFMPPGPGMPPGAGLMPQGSGMMPPGSGAVSAGNPMMLPGTSSMPPPMMGPYQRQQPPMSQFPMLPPPPMLPMPPVLPMPFPWFSFMPYMPPPPNYVAVQTSCQGGSSGATFFCTRID
ncbi:hypothetical protein AAHC03_024215 [Spirometra sp. Aus1]